jgi:hypothetical protein
MTMKLDTIRRFVDAQNNLVVQHSDFSLRAIYDMAVSGSIDLEPHYQRRDRWKPEKQSALIESFILNVPVPPVYLSEDDFGHYSVIDGKQRLTSIRDFLAGGLRLRGLTRFRELEGFSFAELPLQIQNALTVRPYIRVITLLRQTDPQLKYEVFLRLNTGGEKLLAQEIRNVAFSGPLNDLLFELSSVPFLWQQMKIKNDQAPAYRKMEDVEHVLRFLTVADRWENIGQVPSQEMDSFMREHRSASPGALERLRSKFGTALEACERIWGKHAFYKPQGTGWREQFISPLFDAEMVATSLYKANQLERIVQKRDRVLEAFRRAYQEDEQFEKAVSQSTNNPASVKYRISAVQQILEKFA